MHRNIIIAVVACFAAVGCQTPSDVHMKDTKDANLTVNAHYYYTDPGSVAAAQSKLIYEHKLAEAIEKVNNAMDDVTLDLATKQLEAIKSARPVDPVKVAGNVVNYGSRTFLVWVFTDASATNRLGSFHLPPNSERTFYLPPGVLAYFAFYIGNANVGTYTLQNPADTGWMAWVK